MELDRGRKSFRQSQRLRSHHLTVCVTGAGVDGGTPFEQKKLEARKMLENAAESPASSACFVSPLFAFRHFRFGHNSLFPLLLENVVYAF